MTRHVDYYIDFVDGKVERRMHPHQHGDWRDYKDSSVTHALTARASSILDIQPQEDGSFKLIEGCDEYYVVQLSREAFQQWVRELQEMLDDN